MENGVQVSKHKIYIIDLTKSDSCDNLELRRWLELIKSENPQSFKGESIVMDKITKKFLK